MKGGEWAAALAAFLLLVFACAPPPPNKTQNAQIPSPTPTTPVQVSAAAPFHGGEVGIAYAPVALSAIGGVQPYKWTVSAGALPGGLTLGNDGSVSGTPTAAGTFTFTIQAADSGDSSASLPGTISIAPALSASLIPACATYCNVELGCVSVCGSFGQLSGGVSPYTYSLVGGTLPSGTTLSGFSLTGTFGGSSGWLQFTVQAGDALGATTTISPKFWMYNHISLPGSATCYGNFGTGCKAQLQISGGVPNDNFAVKLIANNRPGPNQGCGSYGPPPSGSLTVSGSNVVVAIPANLMSGYGAIWTIQVTDSALCAAASNCASNDATVVVEVQCG